MLLIMFTNEFLGFYVSLRYENFGNRCRVQSQSQ